MVSDKDYFVITTNIDHQFQRAGFDKKRLFYTQGDYGLFQSVNPAIQKTFDNEEWVIREADSLLCSLDRIFDDALVFNIRGESFRGKRLENIALQAGSPYAPMATGSTVS